MSEKHQMPGYRPSALGAATKVRIGEPGREMSAYSVLTTISLFPENSGGKARASQLLNSRDGLLLTLTKCFAFPADQFCIIVKLFAKQPLLSCFRFLLILQDIRNGLIDHCQKQAPCCFRMELLRLKCHKGPSPFRP